MPHTIDDVVDYIMDKDHINLKAAIDDIMASKIDDALDARKQYVASRLFNPDAEESDDTED